MKIKGQIIDTLIIDKIEYRWTPDVFGNMFWNKVSVEKSNKPALEDSEWLKEHNRKMIPINQMIERVIAERKKSGTWK